MPRSEAERLHLPHFLSVLEALYIVIELQVRRHTMLGQQIYGLTDGQPGDLGCFAQRCLTGAIVFNGKHLSAFLNQSSDRLGDVLFFLSRQTTQECVFLRIYADTQGFLRLCYLSSPSSRRLASSRISR